MSRRASNTSRIVVAWASITRVLRSPPRGPGRGSPFSRSSAHPDPRHLGAEIGGVAVLHSWGQARQHHPHVHCIVPGGGLSPDRTHWIA